MASASPPSSMPTGLRAFVVEDETLVSMLLEDLLEELGCTVVGTAAQVARALRLVDTIPADIAIIDINLAGEKSYPIAEALQSHHIPFIFATGYGDSLLHPKWQHCPVIQKPYQKSDLERAMTQVLADRRNTDQSLNSM